MVIAQLKCIIICAMLQKYGYDYADLEGVDGTFDDYLSKTKAKYNPVVLEFVGEFDISINKFWYFIFSNFSVQLKKLYRLVKGNK